MKMLGGLAALMVLNCISGMAVTNAPVQWQEVYDLLKANLAGVSDAKLNQAAVDGLLQQLKPAVLLAGEGLPSGTVTNAPLLSQTRLFDEAYGYIRIGRVENGLAEEIGKAIGSLKATNELKGLVLDLRYAAGTDYAAAAKAADGFVASERPLISWGGDTVRSTAKTNAWQVSLAILVNPQTMGAAEAFAAILRQEEVGLIIGMTTAGQATVFKEFPLSNGQQLRIATAAIRLGNGQPMALQGLTPDIRVTVSTEDEKGYYADPFKVQTNVLALLTAKDEVTNKTTNASTTNRPNQRLNEAELVRRQKEGQNVNDDVSLATTKDLEPAKLVIQDPALARAMDLLKALVVVKKQMKQP